MTAFWQGMAQHMAAYGIGSGVLIVAIITTWPQVPPKTWMDWWTWIRDALQTAIPARPAHRQPSDIPPPQPPLDK